MSLSCPIPLPMVSLKFRGINFIIFFSRGSNLVLFGKGAQIHQMGTGRQVDRQEDKEYDSLIHASLESQAKIVRKKPHIYTHICINTFKYRDGCSKDFKRKPVKEKRSLNKKKSLLPISVAHIPHIFPNFN